MLTSLIRISVRFRFLVVALAAGVMIVGAGVLPGMHSDVLPETAPVVVEIQTNAPGLAAPEVESLVTVPLEKNLLEGVMGVTDVTSDSIPGLSQIDLHFAPGTGLYQARQLVQERLTQAFILPSVSAPPVMRQPISSTGNVMLVGLTSKTMNLVDLSVLARWTIVPRLLGVAGVAEVATFGQADRQLQVLVDPTVLAAHHISVNQIISSVGNSQLVTPLSYLNGSTPGTGGFLEDSNQRITIRHILPFGTPANLGQIPVAVVKTKPVLLGNVTTIVNGHNPLIGDAQIRGQAGLILVIQKLPSASVPAVTQGLDQALAQLRPALPGVTIDASLFRPGTYITTSGRDIRLALILIFVLAAVALAALLLNLRLIFISLAAMALSLTAATLVLYLLGYTFNALVLLGLLLALAVVVDDAAGGAYHLMGLLAAGRAKSQRRAAGPLVLAAYRDFQGVLAAGSVCALVAVVPLLVSSGLTAEFLRPMVLAFGLAVLASMIVALLVSPGLAALLFAVGKSEPAGLMLARPLRRAYTRAITSAQRLPAWLLLGAVLVGLGGLVAMVPRLHPGQPVFTDRSLMVDWSGAPGMSLPELNRVSEIATSELLALPSVQDVGTTLGRATSSEQPVITNTGQLWVTIKPGANYDQAVAAVRSVVGGTPGMHGTVSTYESASTGSALLAPPRSAVVRVYGPDLTVLTGLAEQVKGVMARVPGIVGAHVELPVEQPTINVEVNLVKARLVGLTPGAVRREAGTLLSGLTVGNFFQDQKVFDVVVWGTPAVRTSASSVGNLLIDTPSGGHVRLGSVATVTVAPEPVDIKHDATSPYLDVTGHVTGRSVASADAAVASGLNSLTFPLEYHTEFPAVTAGGTSRPAFVSYLLAALLAIALLVQAACRSWRLAALVLAAVMLPLAAAAVMVLLIGTTSLAAMAGLIAVLAIALRQAISVTAGIRRHHAADDGELTAGMVATAAGDAAGPVIAAAVVTAVMLIPFLVLGDVPGNELTRSAAAVILVGLVIATVVDVFLLPAGYLAAGPKSAEVEQDEETEPGELAWAASASGADV
ncbi:MAG TPA: efflux RND transporter permease subunit [Streptosporangiaceae bacterium]